MENYKELLVSNKMKIGIWGNGYIGLSTMAYFAKQGINCIGTDINKITVDTINQGELPIKDLKDWFGFEIKSLVENNKIKGVNNWVISTNFDMSVPKLPAKLFMDFAMIEGDVIYFDLGLKKTFGPLMLILPLYQSWDVPSMIDDKNWLSNRIRFSFSVSSFNVRNIF